MSITTVNLGTYANDGTGDDLRTAFIKANNNFSTLDTTKVENAENLGTGSPVFVGKDTVNLQFRSIKQGANMIISHNGEEITVAAPDSINAVEEDPNPRLGGDLDLNGYSIFANLPIEVTAHNTTILLSAYNTTTENFNEITLNSLVISGNNKNIPGETLITNRVGDSLTFYSSQNLTLGAVNGILNLEAGVSINATAEINAPFFIGDLTGDVTGDLTGNVTGNLTGNTTGTHFGPVNGNVSGNVLGNVTGNLTGNVRASNGLTVLNAGTTGLNAVFTGNVTGQVSDISNHNLSALGDVTSTAPSNGQALVWNGTNWTPGTITSGVSKIIAGANVTISPTNGLGDVTINSSSSATTLDQLTDVAINSPASGEVLQYNGTSWVNAVGGGTGISNSFDFGTLGGNITNPLQLLVQALPVDFETFDYQTGLNLDLGTIGGGAGPVGWTTGDVDGGGPATVVFDTEADGGTPTSSVFAATMDGGSPGSSGTEWTSGDIDAGAASTTVFEFFISAGIPSTTSFTATADGGGVTPPVPTFSITPAASSVDEGSSLTFNVSGTDITNGTYYWTVSSSGDFTASFTAASSGSFTITGNAGSFSVTPTADATTEGAETFTVSVRTGSTSGTVVATSSSVTINDTSTTPAPGATYSITPAASSVNEGSSLTFNVSGTGITDGTYYWTITNSGDFGTISGSFTITSNSGSFSVTPTADATTEGSETFTASVRTGSTSGTVVATSSSVTINDTSTTVVLVPADSVEYTTPGTYSWTAPAGVGSVCVVAVGGGASGSYNGGGGGGGLGWKNYIPVVPGQSYTVVVGAAGTTPISSDGQDGSDSYFINTGTVAGLGGKARITIVAPDPLGYGGGYVGDGGGAGGRSAGGAPFIADRYYGGGSAGGYTGAGAGGSTGSGPGNYNGLGAGLLGQGSSGTGMSYGGGRLGASESSGQNNGGSGGGGAVRIVWGEGISYPSNAQYLPIAVPGEFNLPRFGLTSNNAFMIELEEDTTNTPTFVFDVTGFNVISNSAFMTELEEDTTNTPTFVFDVTGFNVISNSAFMLELEEDTTNTPTFEIDVTGFSVISNNDYFTP